MPNLAATVDAAIACGNRLALFKPAGTGAHAQVEHERCAACKARACSEPTLRQTQTPAADATVLTCPLWRAHKDAPPPPPPPKKASRTSPYPIGVWAQRPQGADCRGIEPGDSNPGLASFATSARWSGCQCKRRQCACACATSAHTA